jgi:phospholipid transport system transporter-binding protein
MSATTAAATAEGRIVLGSCCTIQEVGALKAQLLRQLEGQPPFLLDGAAVERVDTAGLQAILAFTLDCLERNIAFAWVARSEALSAAIELLSLAPLLESPGTSITPATVA